MKEVKIKVENIEEYFELKRKYFFNHFFGVKSYLSIIIFFLIGISLTIISIISDYDYKSIVAKDGGQQIINYNYGITLTIGIILLVYSMLILLSIIRNKKAYQKQFKNKLDKLKKYNSIINFHFSNDSFLVLTKLKKTNINWSHFDFYDFDSNYLKLYNNNYKVDYPEYIIPLSLISEIDKKEIENILKGKVLSL